METCSSCGANLVDNAKYCNECGAYVLKNTTTQEFSVSADEVTKKVRELLHEGNLLEIPVTAGVVGVLIAPWLAAAGVIAAFATKCTIVVVRKKTATEQTNNV